MMSWDRCGRSGYVGVFGRREITVLRTYVTGFLEVVEHRIASYVPVAVGHGREVRVPVSVTDDPRLLAILEDEVGAGEPDWALVVGEGPCLWRAHGLLALMSATLPEGDCVVHLRSAEEAEAWLRCIGYFLSSIVGMADAHGMLRGVDTAPTITWLCALSGSLRLAVTRTVMA